MGRKIPAKKHRGVKDPLVQQERRLQSLKSKINAPPKDPDEQPVPRSLTRLFAFQNKDNTETKVKKKIQKRKQITENNNNSKNPIASLKKLPGESGRSFSLRINSAIRALHTEVDAEDYPQDMEDEDVKGQMMAEHKMRREKKRRRAGAKSADAAPTRAERLALKKQEQLKKAELRLADKREIQHENVAFGEVVHAPPALTFKHRTPNTHRPGQRELLLTRLLKPATESDNAQKARSAALTADQQRRERARLDAVEAYRVLKALKHKNKPNKLGM